ncbi:hypothetical protein H0H93_006290, partial [Arthromyces matolae]
EAAESKDPRKVEGPEQPSIAKPPSNIEASDQESRRTASATLKTLNPTGGLGDIAAKDAMLHLPLFELGKTSQIVLRNLR